MSALPDASKQVLKYLFGHRLPRKGVPSLWPSMTRPGSQRFSRRRRSLASRRARGNSRKILARLQRLRIWEQR
eukprot:207075-Chlamydomonas_euryale.AAC.1